MEAMLKGIDVKYAFIPGYEERMRGRERFELWWPKSVALPEDYAVPSCV